MASYRGGTALANSYFRGGPATLTSTAGGGVPIPPTGFAFKTETVNGNAYYLTENVGGQTLYLIEAI